jgi:hypothetical protein
VHIEYSAFLGVRKMTLYVYHATVTFCPFFNLVWNSVLRFLYLVALIYNVKADSGFRVVIYYFLCVCPCGATKHVNVTYNI